METLINMAIAVKIQSDLLLKDIDSSQETDANARSIIFLCENIKELAYKLRGNANV